MVDQKYNLPGSVCPGGPQGRWPVPPYRQEHSKAGHTEGYADHFTHPVKAR